SSSVAGLMVVILDKLDLLYAYQDNGRSGGGVPDGHKVVSQRSSHVDSTSAGLHRAALARHAQSGRRACRNDNYVS
ncbi:hypothetical protein, partial [Sulfitobacter sp.]|uniref:hypothetical protein n=1 Tax=Sulfitobacter sp. TaxID=1903071 RepID=UPI0040581DC9